MVVINFSKNSYNLILSIPPLPYKSHPKTPFADIANIPVYFLNTSCECVFITHRFPKLCHGLLRCQSVKHNCEIIHNRDKNAVQNMLNIVSSIFNTGKRPEAFCRAINS